MLGSYTLVEPCVVPLEIGLRISVPLYLIALTERLNARPVRLVFDWLSDVFGRTIRGSVTIQTEQSTERIRCRFQEDV